MSAQGGGSAGAPGASGVGVPGRGARDGHAAGDGGPDSAFRRGADRGSNESGVTGTKPAGRRGPGAKSAERRQAIVEAAHAVFAERGYHAGSFQEIADRVGMSQTGLLYYFPSKSELLLEVLHRRDAVSAGRVNASGGAATAHTPDQAVLAASAFVDRILVRAEANESIPGVIELYTVLCGESATAGHPARPYFVDRFEGLRIRYAAELRELHDQGLLRRGIDPDRAAASLIALWDGIQLQWLLAPDRVDVVACLRDHLELLLEPAPST